MHLVVNSLARNEDYLRQREAELERGQGPAVFIFVGKTGTAITRWWDAPNQTPKTLAPNNDISPETRAASFVVIPKTQSHHHRR